MVSSVQSSSWSGDLLSVQSGSGKHKPPSPEMMFKTADTDQDGKISKEELETFAKKIEEKTGQTLDVDQMFADYDEDQDGSLSVGELDKAMKSQMKPMQGPPPGQGPSPEEIFKKADQDGDGKISKTELQTLTTEMEKKSGKKLDVDQLLGTYDTDNDGSLTSDEFDALMKTEMAPPDGGMAMQSMFQGQSGTQSSDSSSGTFSWLNLEA